MKPNRYVHIQIQTYDGVYTLSIQGSIPTPLPETLGPTHRIDGLPSNQHRHDRGLAGAGRQLERQPWQWQVWIGVIVGVLQMVEKVPTRSRVRRNLSEPDQSRPVPNADSDARKAS